MTSIVEWDLHVRVPDDHRAEFAHYAAVTTRITADGNRGIRITVSDADDNPLSDVRIQPEAAVILATDVLSTCLPQLLHDGGAR